jgi:hypothetical protein
MADSNHHCSVHLVYWNLLLNHLRRKYTPVIYHNFGYRTRNGKRNTLLHYYLHIYSDYHADATFLHELPQEHIDQRPSAGEKGAGESVNEKLHKEGENHSEGG